MTKPMCTSSLFTIPPTVSFTDILAKGLMEEVGSAPEKLAQYLILLPTRRGCRSVQEAFLRQSEGAPLMLPRLHPIGDVDGEELFINGASSGIEDILPAMPPLKRQILLSQLIAALPSISKTPEQDMRLARTLGQLMDQIYTENLNIAALPDIVDRDAFAEHWQVTVDFLKILSENWPEILKAHGMIDVADRRNRLINALSNYWTTNPPNYPVIAAGSTGSIPATNNLLKVISTLPQGSIILPGLDQTMTDKAWNMVEEGHPQNTLKELLENLGHTRQNVKIWHGVKDIGIEQNPREKFISNVMLPPDSTHEWRAINLSKPEKQELENSLKKVQLLECDSLQSEAQVIATILRETVNDSASDKTAALITPNRYLARRVATICKRWNIDIDDSGGMPLSETAIGIYFESIMQVVITQASPVALLSLLKHSFCKGAGYKNYRSNVRDLDKTILRGLKPAIGFKGLRQQYHAKLNDEKNKNKPSPKTLEFINYLEEIFEPLFKVLNEGQKDFLIILNAHIKIAEVLSSDNPSNENNLLWQGDEGEAMANFLYELQTQAQTSQTCSAQDYLAILDHFMKTVSVRAKYGTHPQLMILGQLEARLIQTDRIILSGLNEGIWPPDSGHDPWMSRPMREKFGLPKAERAITLAAHDFSQAFCGKEVFLTRSLREDGVKTVPARWLSRMDTFMKAVDITPDIIRTSPYKDYVLALDHVDKVKPIERPKPKPPKEARPKHLSVTKIETWMKDPYAIYAGSVLKLYALDPIEKEVGAIERGNVLHKAMEKFNQDFPKEILQNAQNRFIEITREVLEAHNFDEAEWNFWIPRMDRLSEWVVNQERQWRENATFGKSEVQGEIKITDGLDNPFILRGIADRIDYFGTGNIAIIDYKSGGEFSVKKIENGQNPQLPLEAMMAQENGFPVTVDRQIAYIGYWKMTGAKEAGSITAIDDVIKLQTTIENTKAGLINLIHTFENEDVAYIAIPRANNAPRFNDYEHFERIKEWAAIDDDGEAAA